MYNNEPVNSPLPFFCEALIFRAKTDLRPVLLWPLYSRLDVEKISYGFDEFRQMAFSGSEGKSRISSIETSGGNVPDINLREVNPAVCEDAKLLVGESKRDFLEVYAPENSFALTADSLGKGNLAFLVGYLGETPVACGGIFELEPGVAEIKSMYVRPEARGRGYSRQLLAALEGKARALGLSCLRLETGDKQQVAIALYQSAGYRRIPPFGLYRNSATSICMEKSLKMPDTSSK